MVKPIIICLVLVILALLSTSATASKIAFMAHDEEGALGFLGHVGCGFQLDDGRCLFASFGPEPGHAGGATLQPGKLDDQIFNSWDEVLSYLSTNGYETYKIFFVDDPKPINAWFSMDSHREIYYDWNAGETGISENCLTLAKKVLESYGVTGLPALSWDKRSPNDYYKSITVSTAQSVNNPSTRQLSTLGAQSAPIPTTDQTVTQLSGSGFSDWLRPNWLQARMQSTRGAGGLDSWGNYPKGMGPRKSTGPYDWNYDPTSIIDPLFTNNDPTFRDALLNSVR